MFIHTFFLKLILKSFCKELYDIKYSYWIQIICQQSIWPINGVLTGIITPGQSGSGSDGKYFSLPRALLSKLFFWMMEVCVNGTFFAFTGGSGLVTWLELTSLAEVRNKKLSLFWRQLWRERNAQKRALHLTTENHKGWRNFPLNKKISNGWLRIWWSSVRYPLSIAESSIQKEIFLIADLRKFYRISNSIAESLIQKDMFIIAEQRQFFQVFYGGIAMLWTQKLWMQNTRLVGLLHFKTLHKGTF